MTRRVFFRTSAAALGSWALACAAPTVETKPQRVPVQSTSLAAVGYDATARTLDIEFRSGAIYRYREVPAAVFAELLQADSKGRYFAKRIRGQFTYVLLRSSKK